jgi:hypothetical protein
MRERKLLIVEEGMPLTVEVPYSWPKVFIFRFLQKEYGRCLHRTTDGWQFRKASVIVEGATPVISWRLGGV